MKKFLPLLAISFLLLSPLSAFAQHQGPNPFQVLLAGPFGALCIAVFAIIGISCFLFSGGGNANAKKVGASESMMIFGSICLVISVFVYFKRAHFENEKLKFSAEQKAQYGIY